MRLTNNMRTSNVMNPAQNTPPAEELAAPEKPANPFEEPAVLLELSFNPRSEDAKSGIFGLLRDKEVKNKEPGGLDDASGRLTKRLVAANSREEVQTILSEAYKNLGEALKAAAGGDEDALKVIRRLNKLIRRATRKIRDLSKENDIKEKEKKAEKDKLEQLAKQLEDELKRKIAERKKREKNYLRDAHKPDDEKQPPLLTRPSIAALQAKMMALTNLMQQTNAAPSPSPSGDIAGAMSSAGGDVSQAEEEA